MGGGGGGGFSFRNLKALEKKAKEELKRGESDRRNVFLSFAYEDINEVNLLRGQAKNEKSNIEFNDWSVQEPFDSERAAYIKQKIGERISQCSVTVVYVSDAAVKSNWVDWEIRETKTRGKDVIAVYSGDVSPTDLPQAVTEFGIKVVPWSKLGDTLK